MYIIIGIITLIIIISMGKTLLFPKVNLLKPSGKYIVGTTRFDFTDDKRYEEIKGHKDELRTLTVQIWYPANNDGNYKKALWMAKPNKMAKYFSEIEKIPKMLLKNISIAETDSFIDAPLSNDKEKYPVIIFSHGYAGFLGQNTIQMQELASHGYIVCSISHTYECFAVTRNDGRVIPGDSNRIKELDEDNETIEEKKYLKRLLEMTIEEKSEAEWNRLKNHPIEVERANVWIKDQKFIIDELEKLNRGDYETIFKNRLELENLGTFGHSFGGSTAIHVALSDDRVKAGINMDGSTNGQVTNLKFNTPIMFLNSNIRINKHVFLGDFMNISLFDKSELDAYHIKIKDSSHMNFSEFPYISPLLKLTPIVGKINNTKMQKIINNYVLEFFNKYLKDLSSELLDNDLKKYDEVVLRRKER